MRVLVLCEVRGVCLDHRLVGAALGPFAGLPWFWLDNIGTPLVWFILGTNTLRREKLMQILEGAL